MLSCRRELFCRQVAGEVEDVIGLDCSEAIAASAKQGIGIEVSPWSGSRAARGGQAQSMTSVPRPSPALGHPRGGGPEGAY